MTIAVPAASGGTGTTLARYCELLGEQLGTYVRYAVSTTASTGEAGRLVLLDEARDDELHMEEWGNRLYVYARAGAQVGNQRRVLRNGYEGPIGAFVLSRPWASALVQGSTVVISEPLPVQRHLQTKGLVTLANEALHLIDVEARITITGDGSQSYSLDAYPFIRSRQDVLGIRDRFGASTTDPTGPTPWPWDINTNGVTVTVETGYPYPASQIFEVVVPVPADRLTYDGASWSYTTTPGLVNDTDQAAAKPDHVVALGMAKGLRYLMRQTMADERMSDAARQMRMADLSHRLRPWVRAAANVQRYEMPKRLPPPKSSMISGALRSSIPGWP